VANNISPSRAVQNLRYGKALHRFDECCLDCRFGLFRYSFCRLLSFDACPTPDGGVASHKNRADPNIVSEDFKSSAELAVIAFRYAYANDIHANCGARLTTRGQVQGAPGDCDIYRYRAGNLVVLSVDGQALIDAYVQVSRADANWPEGARNMGKNDIWIAATAVNAGLPLLTTDKDCRFLHGNLLQVLWIDPELKNHSIN